MTIKVKLLQSDELQRFDDFTVIIEQLKHFCKDTYATGDKQERQLWQYDNI